MDNLIFGINSVENYRKKQKKNKKKNKKRSIRNSRLRIAKLFRYMLDIAHSLSNYFIRPKKGSTPHQIYPWKVGRLRCFVSG